MKTVEIKGVVVFDAKEGMYKFTDWPRADLFKEDGSYTCEYFSYILVEEYTITVELPADFDIIQPQLNALEAQKKELTLQYKQALNHIQVKRNNLLAIENDIRNI